MKEGVDIQEDGHQDVASAIVSVRLSQKMQCRYYKDYRT